MNKFLYRLVLISVIVCLNNMSLWTNQEKNQGGQGNNTFLLQEDGFFLLLESGGKIILNTGFIDTIWTNQTEN